MRARRSRASVAVAVAVVALLAACGPDAAPVGDGATPVNPPVEAAAPVVTPSPTPTAPPPVPSDQRTLERVDRITGDMTPKSVVASGAGIVVAQNMIYTHTVTVFDSAGQRLGDVDDEVTPSDWGYEQWDEPVQGGPVEAAFSRDGSQLWVSNYSMYGPGFPTPGDDDCTPGTGVDDAFVYRIDPATREIADVVLVGAVPKFLEVTPDGRYLLVTNWCTWDLSIVSTGLDGSEAREVARVPMGRYPRGIAISPDSSTAYVAIMGASELAVVDVAEAVRLSTAAQAEQDVADGDAPDPAADAAVEATEPAVSTFEDVGRGPRHLNLSPDGTTLYLTLNKDGEVAKVDARTGAVLGTVRTGQQPRSSVLSPDGTALFVVNYESDTVSRVRTSDLVELETVAVDHHPIGITYDPVTDQVWVAAYGGSLTLFADAPPGPPVGDDPTASP